MQQAQATTLFRELRELQQNRYRNFFPNIAPPAAA
jgi:hypothetical protein